MNEYILVLFDEVREVVIDGNPSGCQTGKVIEIGAGTHSITLANPKDFAPGKQDIEPSGSSPLKPDKVLFQRI